MPTAIRRAAAGDAAAVAEITRAAYRPYIERIGREPAPMRADFDALIGAGAVWLATEDGRVVGVLVLELQDNGGFAINTKPVAKQALDAELHTIYDQRPAKLMFIKASPNRQYQDVVEAMDIARGAGVQVIGFVPPAEATAAKQ